MTRLGVVLLATAGTGLAGRAAAEEKPFPVARSTILREEGTVYTVEGRQTIPWGCEISCQKDVKIVGKGVDSVLVVEGSLQIHGVRDREVILERLRVEPAARLEDVHLDMVIFRERAGLRTPAGQAASGGRIFLENVIFEQDCPLEVSLAEGRIDLSSLAALEPVRILGVAGGDKPCPLVVNVRGCFSTMGGTSGFGGGLFVSGAKDVTVRLSRLGGEVSEFADNRQVTFDGNKVNSRQLVFRQTKEGRFGKTKLQKCDVYSDRVVLKAPPGNESCTIDKCWFQGARDRKDILARVIQDGEDDPECGMVAKFLKVNDRPLELAGDVVSPTASSSRTFASNARTCCRRSPTWPVITATCSSSSAQRAHLSAAPT